MPYTTHAYYRSVAKSGFTVMTPVADTKDVRVVNTNFFEFTEDRIAWYAHLLSGAIANTVRAYIKHSADGNYLSWSAAEDQTGNRMEGQVIGYQIPKGAGLTAYVDNGNTNQLEVVLVNVGDSMRSYSLRMPKELQGQVKVVRGTGTATNVAGTWTPATITWDYTFIRGKKYRIVGMRAFQATGYAARLTFTEPENAAHAPGVPAGDTNALAPMFWFDGPTFDGATPPNIESLSSAGDTAQVVDLAIVEA